MEKLVFWFLLWDKYLQILLVFALYSAMIVDNDYKEIRHDLYNHILYILLVFVLYPGSGVAKGRPGWGSACPTYINCLPKSLVCPVIGIKRSMYSDKTV